MQKLKAIIVYYSATGNTRKVARAIWSGMKQVLGDCDIAAIKEVNAQDLSKYDIIGFGSPIWSLSEPANVRIFLHNLPSLKGKLAFAFCTHGATPVSYMHSVTTALIEKGITIIGYRDWYGGVRQLACMPKPYATDGHPDEIDLKEAEDFGREMAKRSRRIFAGETQLIPELPEWKEGVDPLWKPNGAASEPLAKEVAKLERQTKKERKINKEKCKYPECTICVDNCPMNAIDLSVAAVFKKNCIVCHLCDAVCPEGAIEYDQEPYYRIHVDYGFYDFKDLREQEAKGRFRPLVPWDKIGADGPAYKQNKRPFYVITE